jgi:hypothetical protein
MEGNEMSQSNTLGVRGKMASFLTAVAVVLTVAPALVAQLPQGFPSGLPGAAGMRAGSPVPAPQALGAKAPGKIRIGVVSAQAQLGQGNNAEADFGAPIRNSIVLLMSGPAVEITALDARLPIQVQAEAQQKQCDYVLYSSVVVKHNSGGFGKFMKAAGPVSNMIPLVGMTNMASAMATQAAAVAVAQTAQQQAINQLAGFNKQIKNKDDVTVGYQMFAAGDPSAAKLQNTLNGKAKSDGEDVLTPLLQQVANTILTEVTKH